MESRISRSLLRVLAVFALVITCGFWVMAQDDPDPNSPTPIVLSEVNSTRALAQNVRNAVRVPLNKIPTSQAFPPDSEVVLYVTDLSLMDGEGANAFRVYATDDQGHLYGFPVLNLQRVSAAKNVYAMTIQLTDDIGYWETPPEGDLAVYVTWRGLGSNSVKLGIGKIGSDDLDIPGARPTPLGTTAVASERSARSGKSVSPDFVGYRFAGDRRRFLEQATFGPTQALDDRIRRIGLKTWLAEQFDPTLPYPSLSNPYPNQPLKPGNPQPDCDNDQVNTVPDVPITCFRDTYTMYPIQQWNSVESLYGTAPLRHRVTWALSQIWVNSGFNGDTQQSRHLIEYHKILSRNAFGNFRNLMGDLTLSPTMGNYLSMSLSTKNNPNENYAREIMQLFTIGLFMLNQDGTIICVEHNPCQAGDTPTPSYDQNTVNNLTKVLTGWTFCQVQASCPNVAVGTVNYIDPMLLNTANHDLTAKTLTSYAGSSATTNIAACAAPCTTAAQITTYANASMNQALDNLFNHPNVGPFISRIMIQHMVTSTPTPAYVSRVAGVFNNNGSGVRGDMKAVVKAILLDPEARGDTKTDPNYGKLREPFQFATNFLISFNVRSADGLSQSDGYLNGRGEYTAMGQIPLMSPTVFNYFQPDYVIPNTALIGPEFELLTTGTAIQRANFMNRMVFTAPAIPVAAPNNPSGMSVDFGDLQALSTADSTGGLLLDELNRRMMHGTMSAQMKSTIQTAVTNIPNVTATDTLNRARQAVYLVATSSQYQVQR